ncbi:hypothetical protein A2Z10_00895 [Candidatus Azambacteria bacterium RBG_16_47_10]|uniref:Methyltransferase domain-containing protein n=1 Tax=Candidatus Azambacteria bacterium RBG_16_47_10 TaxID=1797292 RepID=A0A1F5B0M5_9BACT|nr:MAG: hypothetical protein A2Z10_00895 [Candidatus Azambacteria bacterium RBG_16_47_10]
MNMRNKTSDQEGGGSLLYPEKYENPFFIDKYTALWAYGYKNGIGYSEGLYRTINELGFTYFERNGNYKILDIGCGAGRTSADYAKFFNKSGVVGIDNARLMIDMACRLHFMQDDIVFDMSRVGFGKLKIKGEKIGNLQFHHLGLDEFYIKTAKEDFDIITAVNIIDRVSDIKNVLDSTYNLLKKSGILILSTPLNFANVQDWNSYGSYESFMGLIRESGFLADVAFDNFMYKEILDNRGAIEEYPTIIMRLKKI